MPFQNIVGTYAGPATIAMKCKKDEQNHDNTNSLARRQYQIHEIITHATIQDLYGGTKGNPSVLSGQQSNDHQQ